jgi:hypothetical protein
MHLRRWGWRVQSMVRKFWDMKDMFGHKRSSHPVNGLANLESESEFDNRFIQSYIPFFTQAKKDLR